MTPEQRERFGAAFLEDDDYHLALACREPGDDSALGINYHRPAAGDAPRHHRDPRRRPLDHQRRQGLHRQRADRQADRGRGADRQGRGAVPGAARHAGPHRHRAARAALVSRLLRPAFAEGCPRAGRKSSGHQRRDRPRPRRAPRPGAQPRHRPRRLRGRAGICRASRPGRPPHRRAPGDRNQARRDRDPARYRPHRHLAGGLGLRPSRRLCRPQPARPAAHHHRQGVHRRDDLSRRERRRRMLRRHGRDARHAAAEIHPRRADLPAHRRRQRRRQAADRRGAGQPPARANRCSPRNKRNATWTFH